MIYGCGVGILRSTKIYFQFDPIISYVAKHQQRCKTISKIQLHSKQKQPKCSIY